MKKPKSEIYVYTLGIGCTAKGVGNVGPFGLVSLTRMKSVGKIGGPVDEKNTEGPTTRLMFTTAASVDALISELKPVARKMRAWDRAMVKAAKETQKQMKDQGTEIIINATDHSTTRHSDKRRKISGARAKR